MASGNVGGIAGIFDNMKQRTLQEQMASTERRADLEPYVWDDPMRRLGLKTANERRVFGAPDNDSSFGAHYFQSWNTNAPKAAADVEAMGGMEYYNQMYGGTGADTMFPPGTMYIDDTGGDAFLAHEAGHAGYDALAQQGAIPPELERMFTLDPRLEEMVVEGRDMPHTDEYWPMPDRGDFWDLPEGVPEDAQAVYGMNQTIEFYDKLDPNQKGIVDWAGQTLQKEAQRLLREQYNEPPKSVPARYRDDYEF